MREENRRDLDVVVDHLALGEPGFRPEHLVEIGDRQLAAFHDQLGFFAHCLVIASRQRFAPVISNRRRTERDLTVVNLHFHLENTRTQILRSFAVYAARDDILGANTHSSRKESLRRKHRLRLADARHAVLPGFVSAQDQDFDPQEIDRHFRFR